MHFRQILTSTLLALIPFGALAQSPHPMAAVGRLDLGVRGGCTATLIAEDLALTAAHCVLSPDGGTPMAEDAISFRTGAYPGQPGVVRQAVRVAIHPLFELNLQPVERKLRFDLAFIRLDMAIPPDVAAPLGFSDPPGAGARALVASYRGRGMPRARERTCPVIAGAEDLVTLGCKVDPGESGAPVLAATAHGPEIVAVISSKGQAGYQKLALAAVVKPRLGALLDGINHPAKSE